MGYLFSGNFDQERHPCFARRQPIAFTGGRNVFYTFLRAFGYHHPHHDPAKLAAAVCASRSWTLKELCFNTGSHTPVEKPF